MPTHRAVSRKSLVLQKVYWRASEAREVLDLWRRSGESLSAFAREHGLCRNRLARWRDRLGTDGPAPEFHPVRLVEHRVRPPAAEAMAGGIEVVLSGGRRVTVRPGFDGDLLAEVIRVLDALPC
ncbi:MAG: helix-turn-helix domain-containing protein [Planctomycetes bacterium]|nr:helix-turn-helix domain-containing protein [Planctomycetota bacterium]